MHDLADGDGAAGDCVGHGCRRCWSDIRSGWQVVLEVGAGTGGVYLLRWYWWRINAWSEISAMATALAHDRVAQLGEAVHRIESGGVCQDCIGDDAGDHGGLGDRDAC